MIKLVTNFLFVKILKLKFLKQEFSIARLEITAKSQGSL